MRSLAHSFFHSFIQQVCTELPVPALTREQRTKDTITIRGVERSRCLAEWGPEKVPGRSSMALGPPGMSSAGWDYPREALQVLDGPPGCRVPTHPDPSFFCFQPMTLVL